MSREPVGIIQPPTRWDLKAPRSRAESRQGKAFQTEDTECAKPRRQGTRFKVNMARVVMGHHEDFGCPLEWEPQGGGVGSAGQALSQILTRSLWPHVGRDIRVGSPVRSPQQWRQEVMAAGQDKRGGHGDGDRIDF